MTAEGTLTTHDRREQIPAEEEGTPEGEAAEAVHRPDPAAGRARRIAGRVVTVLAGLLLLAALVVPNQLSHLTPAAFLRIPAEALLAAALVLVIPPRARRTRLVVAGVAGGVAGLLAIGKLFDMGFFSVQARPFDPVLDWPLVRAGFGFLTESIGRGNATAVVVAVVTLGVILLTLLVLAGLRLSRPVTRHRSAAGGTVAALAAAWAVCALLGVQVVPGVPVAAHHYDRLAEVGASLQDSREFVADMAVDAFRDVPGDQLLTALRGKDVVIGWVESYGRDAVTDPEFASPVGETLAAGEEELGAAGFAARSGFLTAATAGGASWLNHATLRSGLWVDNQQRYRTLVDSDRLTLNRAFQRAGWRTVAVMPGIFEPWPEGQFFGYDRIYARVDLAYQGPRMNWGITPDQYTVSVFERRERSRADRPPLMAEMALLSSHAPWTPVAPLLDWDEIGDGSVFDSVTPTGEPVEDVLRDSATARVAYGDAIAYSVGTLISYVATYGDDDLVFILLGDHQPAASVTGEDPDREVPVAMITRDRAVLDRIAGWEWQEGLSPGPDAPVWGMDEFRDEFLTAFS